MKSIKWKTDKNEIVKVKNAINKFIKKTLESHTKRIIYYYLEHITFNEYCNQQATIEYNKIINKKNKHEWELEYTFYLSRVIEEGELYNEYTQKYGIELKCD